VTDDLHPASGALVGRTLANGWSVVEEVPRPPGSTGGQHSRGYIVQAPDGTRAYLKALDYSRALASSDVAGELQKATSAYVFERNLLGLCATRRLSKVVRALDHGQERVEGVPGIPTVDYLILELAAADVRAYVDGQNPDARWALRTLHDVATGLSQLHTHRVAHQDVKPSNVLIFDPHTAKLSDLGRALSRDQESPYEALSILGTQLYAPIELLYGEAPSGWTARCQSCDMYLLGSLCVSLFGDAPMTLALLTRIPDELLPWSWSDDYEQVLPVVRAAFVEVIDEFARCVPSEIQAELVGATRELCDPDPRLRGHPKTRRERGSPYRLERYVSLFDRLAKRVEIRGTPHLLR
jgi:serine/threonine protein kinase